MPSIFVEDFAIYVGLDGIPCIFSSTIWQLKSELTKYDELPSRVHMWSCPYYSS